MKASKARSPVYAIAVESPWGGKPWTPWRRESQAPRAPELVRVIGARIAFARVTPLAPPR